VSQSYRGWEDGRLNQDRRDSQDWSSWESIAGLNRLGLTPSSLRDGSNFRLGGLVSSEMFSSGSGHLRSLHHRDWGHQGGGHWNLRSHRQASSSSSGSHRNVGGGHSEPVDIVSSVVNSLDHIVGINVLVAASGHSESVL